MTLSSPTYSNRQLTALLVLRMLIGWHLLYEGITKLWNPNWSAAGYLNDSGGLFKGMFEAMASSPGLMEVVNFLNVWGLIFIGLGLLLGVASRWATIAGIALLGLYFLSHPPLIGLKYALPSEGSYLWVNKNLIEIVALVVLLLFPTSQIVGLDRFLRRNRAETSAVEAEAIQEKMHA
ncbi:MAG: DoxX family membrane protein [Bacteroidota bacterium]